MIDAYAHIRDDLEAARTAAEAALNSAIAGEQAAWERYRNDDRLRADWKAADRLRMRLIRAFDLLDSECKSAADITAGASGTEATA